MTIQPTPGYYPPNYPVYPIWIDPRYYYPPYRPPTYTYTTSSKPEIEVLRDLVETLQKRIEKLEAERDA